MQSVQLLSTIRMSYNAIKMWANAIEMPDQHKY